MKAHNSKTRLIMGIIFSAAIMVSPALASTYYVDPLGNDSTGDGSQSKPWKTLSNACTKVTTGGNTIYLNPGSYQDNNRCNLAVGVNIAGAGKGAVTITTAYTGAMGTGYIYRQTSPANPIVNGNNDISGFTLDGSSKTLTTGIFIRGTDELNIHDIKFQHIKVNAIWIEGYYDWANNTVTPPPAYGQNVLIHDIEIDDATSEADYGWGARQGAIMLGALDGAHVYNLAISENYSTHGTGIKAVPGWLKAFKGHDWKIDTNVANGDAFVFEMYNFLGDSEIYNGTFNHALSLNGGPQTPVSGSVWNLKIHDTVTDFSGFAAGGLGHELSHNYLDFYNNYIANNKARAAGLWTTNYLTASSVNNWRFRNNIIYNCAAGGLTIERGALSNIEIYNNVFDGINNSPYGGYAISTEGFSGSLSGAKIQNNLIMNCKASPLYIHSSLANTIVDHNWFYGNGNSNNITNSSGTTVQSNNTKGIAPNLAGSGNRASQFYRPSSQTANIAYAGVYVGLPYYGTAPNIGAFQFFPPPRNLTAN